MTKADFLTVRWNNMLTVGLGLPTLIYIVVGLSSSAISDKAVFIGLVIVGVVY